MEWCEESRDGSVGIEHIVTIVADIQDFECELVVIVVTFLFFQS